MARRMGRRLGLLFVVAVLPLALWAALPLISGAESPGSIQNKIQSKQNQIEQFTDDNLPTYIRERGDLAFYGLTLRGRLDF